MSSVTIVVYGSYVSQLERKCLCSPLFILNFFITSSPGAVLKMAFPASTHSEFHCCSSSGFCVGVGVGVGPEQKSDRPLFFDVFIFSLRLRHRFNEVKLTCKYNSKTSCNSPTLHSSLGIRISESVDL